MILMTLVIFTSTAYSVASRSNENVQNTVYNQAPEKPTITGPCETECGVMCEYHLTSIDPQGDKLCYEIKCSDSPSCIFNTDYLNSGEVFVFTHCWDDFYQKQNPFVVKARAIDNFGHESEWAFFDVEVENTVKAYNPVFYRFIQQHQLLHQLFLNLLNMVKNT